MTDYHVSQLDGSICAGYNCAAASGAMGLYWQTGEKLTGAQFRAEAGVSCVPGAHTGTGGLYISDVQRVFRAHGATIDYGEIGDPPTNYTRWPPSDLPRRLQAGEGAVLLGDYDALPMQYRASKTFLGDHSVWVHDYRIVAGNDETHWHDPLRKVGMWIPVNAVISYWWKPTSPIRGYAGWVKLQGADMPITAQVTEQWHPTVTNGQSNGVLRATMDRSAPIVTRLPATGHIVTVAEFGTGPSSWRLVQTADRSVLYALRSDWISDGPPKQTGAKEAAAAVSQAAASEAAKYGV